eukprot:15361907-Ditylum_brightwellii.AAC.1
MEWTFKLANALADFMDLTKELEPLPLHSPTLSTFTKSAKWDHLWTDTLGYKCKEVMPIFNKAIHHNSPSMILRRNLHQQQHILPPMTPKYTYTSSSTLTMWHPIGYSGSGKPKLQPPKQTSPDLIKEQDWLSHPHPLNDSGLLNTTKPG